jgi:hypothetical protein
VPTFDEEWDRCSGWLQAALDYAPTHNLSDVKALVEQCAVTFWPARRSALVTEINVFPRMTTFHFWLAGGEINRGALRELLDEIHPKTVAYAREHGCNVMTTSGRPGWARVLGYRPLFYTSVREI